MFGIDGSEFLVIALVAIIVIGPKDMPKMLRAFAKATARMRALGQEFRGHFDDAMREADLQGSAEQLRGLGDKMRGLDPKSKLQQFYAGLAEEAKRPPETEPEAAAEPAPQACAAEEPPQDSPLRADWGIEAACAVEGRRPAAKPGKGEI